MRELFLDDGVDEQVIQELRALWERKITESRAIEHASNTTTNTTSNSKNNSQNSKSNKSQAAAASGGGANAGGQTSVITSNPNHIKNGPSSNSNNSSNSTSRVKEELIEEDRRLHQSLTHPQPPTSQPPQLTTSVVSSQQQQQQMVVNGNLMQQQQQASNLAQPMAPNNIFRTSAIVTNPSGPGQLPAGMSATPNTTPHLIQVLKPTTARGGGGGLGQIPQQSGTHMAQQHPASSGISNRPTIFTMIPSPSSSFSPVSNNSPVSSANNNNTPPLATITSIHSSNNKQQTSNGVGTFTPRIVMPKISYEQHLQQNTTMVTSAANMAASQNRIVTVAPHGHKKRILSNAIADRAALNSASGNNNNGLTSLADVAVSQQQAQANASAAQTHYLNLARQQAAGQRSQQHYGGATQGLLSAAGLQTLTGGGGGNNNHHIILGGGPGGSSSTVSGANSKQVYFLFLFYFIFSMSYSLIESICLFLSPLLMQSTTSTNLTCYC